MSTRAGLAACLLLAACGPGPGGGAERDAPMARALPDDMGGRMFFFESDGRLGGKRTMLMLSCHGDGDNMVLFKAPVALTAAPRGAVRLDWQAGTEKGSAEAQWNGADLWMFRESRVGERFAALFLKGPTATIRFPGETGAAHGATWRRSTTAVALLENQLRAWCLIRR